MMRILILAFILFIGLGIVRGVMSATRDGSPRVPLRYFFLFRQLQSSLRDAKRLVNARPSSQFRPVFGAELLVANGNRGEALLRPETFPAVKLFLDRFQELGVKGVTVSIEYPLFDPEFPHNKDYVEFYRKVASEIRNRNLSLSVESNLVFSNTPFSDLTFDYRTMTLEQLARGKAEMANVILAEIKPDYLTILAEPDTASRLTGFQELLTPEGTATYVNTILSQIPDRKGVKIGAGSGTWSSLDFARALLSETSIDYLEMHLYPVSKTTILRAVEMAKLAWDHGKSVVMNEAWLYKAAPRELAADIAANTEIFKRDAYSFWLPLDREFLSFVVALAQRHQIEYVAPFWSTYFFSTLDYTAKSSRLSYAELNELNNRQAVQNLTKGAFSPLGDFYATLIKGD